jgi:hypothetical protein
MVPQIFVFTAGNPVDRGHLANSIVNPIDERAVFDSFATLFSIAPVIPKAQSAAMLSLIAPQNACPPPFTSSQVLSIEIIIHSFRSVHGDQ